MLLKRIQALVALLNENNTLLNLYLDERPPIEDFVDLKANIFIDEFQAALQFLNEATRHPQTFSQAFIQHMHERENKNRTYAQSFTHTPDSAANNLYWQVVVTFFQPKNLREMLALILPDIQYYIAIDYSENFPTGLTSTETKAYLKAIRPILVLRPIAMLDAPLTTSSALLDFVFTNNTAFYAGNCRGMYYETLVQFYKNIVSLNPELSTRLFDHNPTFNQALLDLQHPTLKVAIAQLILKLRNSSTRSTRDKYATDLASHAVKLFFKYWNLFIPEQQQQLSRLRGNAHCSLGSILNHLEKGECVEEASDWFQSILDNPENHEALLILPTTNGSTYPRRTSYRFQIAQAIDNQNFPIDTLKYYLSTISIKKCDSLISLLLAFPPDLYADLLCQAKIKFKLLDNSYFISKICENMFSPAQEQALAQAIALHHKKFGGEHTALKFALKTKNYIFITIMSTLFNPHFLSSLLCGDMDDNLTVLQKLVNHPQAIAAFFKIYPSTKGYHETVLRNNFDKNCFDYCAHPVSLNLLLAQAPTELDKYHNIKRTIQSAGDYLLTRYISNQEFIASLKSSFNNQHYFLALLVQANIRHFFYHSITRTIFQSLGLFFRPLPTYLQELNHDVEILVESENMLMFQNRIIFFLINEKDEDACKFSDSLLKSLCLAENIDNSLEALKASWAIDEEFLGVVSGYF